jgi:hypothetical protein
MPKLYFHRTSEYSNNARNVAVFVDGEKVLTVPNGGSNVFETSAGEHEIYAKIDWCYSPTLKLNLKETDKQKLEISSFKMAKWMIPLALFCVLVYFAGSYFFHVNLSFLFIVVVPIFLYQIYYLTFGRRKYLQITLLD